MIENWETPKKLGRTGYLIFLNNYVYCVMTRTNHVTEMLQEDLDIVAGTLKTISQVDQWEQRPNFFLNIHNYFFWELNTTNRWFVRNKHRPGGGGFLVHFWGIPNVAKVQSNNHHSFLFISLFLFSFFSFFASLSFHSFFISFFILV